MRSLTLWENILLGKDYLLYYNRAYNFPSLSPEEIRAYQFKKIQKLISLAYNHTEFYKSLYTKHGIYPEDIKTWADFEKLPTVTKDDMVASGLTCVVDTKRYDKNLILSRSSGSSGKIIDIFFENTSWNEQAFITLRMYQQAFGYTPFDKQALIYPSRFPYNSIGGFYKVKYIYSLDDLRKIMQSLLQLQPALIVAYPSILFELITNFKKQCQTLKLKAISTNSEQSTQQQRDFISSVFNCPVYDEYSTEELTLVGYQCKNKNYHIQEDGAYIEILDSDSDKILQKNEIGEIVGTCLVNNTMPFIRYRNGDLGSIAKIACSCGNNGRILNNIEGRKNAAFKLQNGIEISSGRLLDWTYSLILNFRIPISQFQVVQKTINNIEVTIVPKKSYKQKIHDDIIIESFKRDFGNFLEITISKVEKIKKTPAGKHMPIKSLLNN